MSILYDLSVIMANLTQRNIDGLSQSPFSSILKQLPVHSIKQSVARATSRFWHERYLFGKWAL